MPQPLLERPGILTLLITAQGISTSFFLWDVIEDSLAQGAASWADLHIGVEVAAVLAMLTGIVVEVRVLARLLRRQAHLERQVSLAARALHDVINERFSDWSLTAAEQDVAHFTVKGLSISEIARLRGSADGTVKSQLNAIYRKAGVSNRGELLSLLIEEIMDQGTPADPGGAAASARMAKPAGSAALEKAGQ